MFRLPRAKKLRHVYLPSVLPQWLAACTTGFGFAWKSGVAAEVIARPALSHWPEPLRKQALFEHGRAFCVDGDGGAFKHAAGAVAGARDAEDTQMIELAHVHCIYGEKTPIRDLTLILPDVGVVGVFGASGAGKTTLLRLLAGLLQPASGTIEGLAGKRISMVFQEDRLLPWLTAVEKRGARARWKRGGCPRFACCACAFRGGGSAPAGAFRRHAAARSACARA